MASCRKDQKKKNVFLGPPSVCEENLLGKKFICPWICVACEKLCMFVVVKESFTGARTQVSRKWISTKPSIGGSFILI